MASRTLREPLTALTVAVAFNIWPLVAAAAIVVKHGPTARRLTTIITIRS
jgi:hypothetical protein